MIITLSPAQILDFSSEINISRSTTPIYQKEADELNSLLLGLSVEEISQLMSINPQLGYAVYEYINTYNIADTPLRQAVLAYNGMVYQGLDFNTLDEKNIAFAEKHLRLFSGLYGMLKPLDLIKPHRLEMQTKLENNRGKTLYTFWKKALSEHLAEELKQNSNIWVNLNSKEYTKAIDRKLLPKGHQVIEPIFKEAKDDGTYKQIVVYTKKARGMLARFIIENQLEEAEHIKGFDSEGYVYSEQMSSGEEWVFIR